MARPSVQPMPLHKSDAMGSEISMRGSGNSDDSGRGNGSDAAQRLP